MNDDSVDETVTKEDETSCSSASVEDNEELTTDKVFSELVNEADTDERVDDTADKMTTEDDKLELTLRSEELMPDTVAAVTPEILLDIVRKASASVRRSIRAPVIVAMSEACQYSVARAPEGMAVRSVFGQVPDAKNEDVGSVMKFDIASLRSTSYAT
jgi:hypothetical protein